jgi:hypothetical protein
MTRLERVEMGNPVWRLQSLKHKWSLEFERRGERDAGILRCAQNDKRSNYGPYF